jgi:adenosylhomocysteinase
MDDLERSLAWMKRQMPLSAAQEKAMPRLEGVRLACSIHIEPKMVSALEALLERGAGLYLTTCNPATVRDQVATRLTERGALAHAWRGMSAADEAEAARRALAWNPTHLWEMGAALSARIAEGSALSARTADGGAEGAALSARGRAAGAVVAGMESTGSGIARLARLSAEGRVPRYPIFNCDSVPIKEGLHNRFMVGETAWHAFTQSTMLGIRGKRVLVVGYGLVGQGVADSARARGGAVSVAERDPARSLQARYEGFPTGALEDLASNADVIVTATGARHVLAARHLARLTDGCILLNVGHTADEIEVEALGELRDIIPFVQEARIGGKTVYLIAGGSMANLAAGPGDTLDSFDVTLAAMLAGLRFTLSDEARAYGPGVHPLPRAVWEEVARQATGQR